MFTNPVYKVEEVFIACSPAMDWGLDYLGCAKVWNFSQGRGIRIGILDTGIYDKHSGLYGAIIDYKDFTGEGLSQGTSHATHVTGIAVCRGDSIGIAPEACVLVGKVLTDSGIGKKEWIYAGLEWLIKSGVNIISLSLGSHVEYDDIRALIQVAYHKNICIVSAAGNDGLGGINYPAMWSEVLSVGAIDKKGNVTPFSSRGWKLDVCAPGEDILSTYKNNGYATISGTSQATPFVSGLIANLISYRPHTVSEIYRKVRQTAYKTFDNDRGFGVINPMGLFNEI